MCLDCLIDQFILCLGFMFFLCEYPAFVRVHFFNCLLVYSGLSPTLPVNSPPLSCNSPLVQSAALPSQPPISNSPLTSAFPSQPTPLTGVLPTTFTVAQSTFANFTGVLPTHPTSFPGLTSAAFMSPEVCCLLRTCGWR